MRAYVLGCCLAVSVTLAYTGNLLLDAALRGDPPKLTDRPIRVRTSDDRPLDGQRLARTFGTPLRPKPAPSQPPVRAMPMRLAGTLDDHAAAMIDVATGQCRTLRIGDRWNGVELVGVGHGRVTVLREDQTEELTLGQVTSAPTAAVRSDLPIALSSSGGFVRMGRAELERRIPEFLQQAMDSGRVVPAFRDGVMAGFKVFAVRPGTLYDQLGLKNGDVLETVNGQPLSDPQVAFTLAGRLRDTSNIVIGVNRDGQKLSWQLRLD